NDREEPAWKQQGFPVGDDEGDAAHKWRKDGGKGSIKVHGRNAQVPVIRGQSHGVGARFGSGEEGLRGDLYSLGVTGRLRRVDDVRDRPGYWWWRRPTCRAQCRERRPRCADG